MVCFVYNSVAKFKKKIQKNVCSPYYNKKVKNFKIFVNKIKLLI